MADVETDANDLVYAIKDKDKVLTDVVIVKQDDVALSNKASVGTITLATGVTSTGYTTIKEAVENPVMVAASTAYAVAATGEKTVSFKRALNATVSTKDTDLTAYTPAAGQYDLSDNITLFAVTATSEDGSNTVTKYVAVKAETYYTVTVTNNDTDCAVKVSGKVIAAGGSHAVVAEKLTAGSNLELTIELETGKTIGAITATGATAVVFNNVVSLTNVTGDVTVTIAAD